MGITGLWAGPVEGGSFDTTSSKRIAIMGNLVKFSNVVVRQ